MNIFGKFLATYLKVIGNLFEQIGHHLENVSEILLQIVSKLLDTCWKVVGGMSNYCENVEQYWTNSGHVLVFKRRRNCWKLIGISLEHIAIILWIG